MAATESAWSKPGAWALDSEESQASELLHQQQKKEPAADFPSLSTAAATKTKKKSKGQTLSLQEFSTFGSVKKQTTSYQAPSASKGLTTEELMALPTGPRERSAEELDRSKGFRSYGTSSFDRPGRGGSDEPRRQRDSNRDLLAPSRADETDDWGAAKKTTVGNGFERKERDRDRGEGGGFFSDSRADEVDNWASKKTFVPTESRRPERRVGFESNGGADTDTWTKRKEEEGSKFGAFDSLRERRGVGFDSSNDPGAGSESWGRKREEVSGGGRPRLNLQPRTLPVGDKQQEDNGDEVKPKGSNPFGDARPRDEVLKEKEQDPKEIEENLEPFKVKAAAKPKGSNPFGDARPREEVLKEKGQDPKEIEEKLDFFKVKEATGSDVSPAPGRKSFGSGNWRGGLPQEDKRAWRKPESVDASPPSDDKTEEEPVENAVDKDPQT